MRKLLLLLFTLIPAVVWAQRYDLSGRVLVKGTDKPIAQAVVELPQAGLWAVADGDGNFTVKGVPKGATRFVVSCLGYATTETELDVRAGMGRILLYAPEDNLKLESVVVTAKEAPNAMATSRTIGGNAIDHLQMVNASDISSLLPGGKTINPDLTKDNVFSLRSGGSAAGNASFGTAVEVDGVRISTNASLGEMSGASTRNIASTNIESVEVVTGVPSAEYGDISSGVVKISTRKGKTPYTLVLSTNPRTKQISASKGFDLGTDRGVLNSSVEYTRAMKNPTSPYSSYSRTGIALNYQNTFAKVLRFNFGVTTNIGGMNTEDDPDAQMEAFEQRIRKRLAAEHHYDPEDQSALWIRNTMEQYKSMMIVFGGINLFVWIIGLGTLLAGIVGVSNIMLVTVTERTSEFGIRKALGAKPVSIIRLILTESVMITAMFGYIGMVLGVAVMEAVNYVINQTPAQTGNFGGSIFLNPTLDLGVAVSATVVLVIAGLIAGYVPAYRAAQLKTIDALRYNK